MQSLLALIVAVATCAVSQAKEVVVPVHVPEGRIQAPLEPPSKRLEGALKKADAELAAGRLYDAEALYRKAFEVSDQSYLALEGLAHVAAARNDRQEAVRQLRKALPIEPAGRLAQIDLEIGDHLAALKNYPEAEEAYRSAVTDGAAAFRAHYNLGLMIYKQRRFREAETWLRQAESELETLSPAARRANEALTHMLLAECYAVLNFPRYAIAEAQDALDTASGDELRQTARKVEDGVDRPFRRLNLALMYQYDTNVLAPYSTIVDLNGTKAEGGGGMLSRVGLVLQSSPARSWGIGLDYRSTFVAHTEAQLGALDTWVNQPTIWVSWWNLRNTELKLFYDYSHAMLDRNALRLFVQSHGPELTWRLFWDKRHEVAAGYSLRRNYFPADPSEAPANTFNQQSGLEHRAFIRAAFAGPTPFIQPFVQFTFDDNESDGKNFYALINSVEAGFSLWPGGDTTRFIFAGSYSHVDFPDNTSRRADRIGKVRAAFELPLAARLSANVEADFTTSHSNIHELFLYDRIVFNSGLTYALPF